jgi:hypothetical protein
MPPLCVWTETVLAGSHVAGGWDGALMMTQQSAFWLVSWCLAMWTVTSLWRHVAHPHLVATAPVCLADHRMLALLWQKSNTCWVRQLTIFVSVNHRCNFFMVFWLRLLKFLSFYVYMLMSINPLKTEYLLNNIQKFSSYLTGNTLRLHYKAQQVNAVWGNSCCLLWEPYGTHRHCVGRMQSFSVLVCIVTTRL